MSTANKTRLEDIAPRRASSLTLQVSPDLYGSIHEEHVAVGLQLRVLLRNATHDVAGRNAYAGRVMQTLSKHGLQIDQFPQLEKEFAALSLDEDATSTTYDYVGRPIATDEQIQHSEALGEAAALLRQGNLNTGMTPFCRDALGIPDALLRACATANEQQGNWHGVYHAFSLLQKLPRVATLNRKIAATLADGDLETALRFLQEFGDTKAPIDTLYDVSLQALHDQDRHCIDGLEFASYSPVDLSAADRKLLLKLSRNCLRDGLQVGGKKAAESRDQISSIQDIKYGLRGLLLAGEWKKVEQVLRDTATEEVIGMGNHFQLQLRLNEQTPEPTGEFLHDFQCELEHASNHVSDQLIQAGLMLGDMLPEEGKAKLIVQCHNSRNEVATKQVCAAFSMTLLDAYGVVDQQKRLARRSQDGDNDAVESAVMEMLDTSDHEKPAKAARYLNSPSPNMRKQLAVKADSLLADFEQVDDVQPYYSIGERSKKKVLSLVALYDAADRVPAKDLLQLASRTERGMPELGTAPREVYDLLAKHTWVEKA